MSELQQVYLAPAWVLHRYPYRETSVIAELLSRDYGRIGVVVRGARSPTRGRPELAPFRPLSVSFRRRGELANLVAAEEAGASYSFSGAPFLAACYVNELVLRLLPRDDPAPEVYALYSETLVALGSRREPAPAVRRFEGRLLRALGFMPPLDRCGEGRPLLDEAHYRYDPRRGAVPSDEGVRGTVLAAIAAERYEEPGALDIAREIYRKVIASHLGDRRLKSLDVARAVARDLEGGAVRR